MSTNQKLLIVILAVIVIAAGLFMSGILQPATTDGPSSQEEETEDAFVWLDIELTDVATGIKFKISDFQGKPIFLESFAVWCPTCLQQQKIIDEIRQEEGDAIVHISLDTDPNEDEARVREHLDTHGFDWYFAVAPIELTNALTDDFGFRVVSAPTAPLILICEDQSARFLRSGVKSSDELLSELDKGCQME